MGNSWAHKCQGPTMMIIERQGADAFIHTASELCWIAWSTVTYLHFQPDGSNCSLQVSQGNVETSLR